MYVFHIHSKNRHLVFCMILCLGNSFHSSCVALVFIVLLFHLFVLAQLCFLCICFQAIVNHVVVFVLVLYHNLLFLVVFMFRKKRLSISGYYF